MATECCDTIVIILRVGESAPCINAAAAHFWLPYSYLTFVLSLDVYKLFWPYLNADNRFYTLGSANHLVGGSSFGLPSFAAIADVVAWLFHSCRSIEPMLDDLRFLMNICVMTRTSLS